MFFTREDLKRIEDWLIKRSKKDTDFEKASPLKGGEELVIIQDGKNKRLSIRELVGQLSGESGDIDKNVLYESVAMVTPLTAESGELILEVERNNGSYIEFPVPKASIYSAGVMSKEDKKKLDSIIPSGLIVSNNGGAALNICDTKGNIIVRFSGGHIRTKFFDSRNYSTDTTPDNMSIRGTSITVKDADFTGFDIGEGPIVPPAELQQLAYNFPFTLGG